MNIESIKRRLLVKYPFFGSVVANSNFIAEPAVGTAGTDGKNIYYNPNFIDALTDDQQTFIFAHEICHIAFDHVFRSEGIDKKLWNIASDAVINAFLKQDGLPIEGFVDIPEAINFDVEGMYKKLLEEKKQQQNGQGNDQNQKGEQQQNSDSGQNEDDKQSDVGHDTHSMWDIAIKKKHQEEQEMQQSSDENRNKEQEDKKNEEIRKLTELGEKEAFKQNKIEKRKQLEELRKVLASQSHGHGNTTNSEKINITDIGTSEPLINWRRILKETVKYDIDWSYQDAGIEEGVVTAYLEEIPKPETEIVLDTSGSIDETLLRNFLRECKNILQTSKVKVGCFDTQFYGFTEIKNVSDIDNLLFYGGGGTNFDVAVNAFTRRVENKMIFTDGNANMPNTSIDAIWIVFGGIKINPPGGKVIYIDDEQLERLCNAQMTDKTKEKSK